MKKPPANKKVEKAERDIDEKIIQLVSLVREGGSERAFQALRKYLDYYIKLFSNKYRISGCDRDEIEQECLYALRYKAIEDFDASRGKFKSFAILCIKRHLYSIIKGGNQQKRRVLNESVSLDDDRSHGDNLNIGNLVAEEEPAVDEIFEYDEEMKERKDRLMTRLSKLEKIVCALYLKQYTYEEIAEELQRMFPDKGYSKKSCDNSLQRIKAKSIQIRWE